MNGSLFVCLFQLLFVVAVGGNEMFPLLSAIRFGAMFLSVPLYCMPFFIIFIHYFLNLPLFFIPEDLVYITLGIVVLLIQEHCPLLQIFRDIGIFFLVFHLLVNWFYYIFESFLFLWMTFCCQCLSIFIIFHHPDLYNIIGMSDVPVSVVLKMSCV